MHAFRHLPAGRAARQTLRFATAGLVLLGLAACTPAHTYAPDSVAPGVAATGRSEASAPLASTVPHDQVARSSSATSTDASPELAAAAMEAFCRPSRTRQMWIEGIDRYLTLQAAASYATVQPSRVACTRVTGTPHRDEGDGYTQVMTVPTNAGRYQVTVTRAALSEQWLVSRVAPAMAR